MTSTSTLKNDIIRFVYAETSITEKEEFLSAMLIHDDLYEFYMQTSFVKEQVEQVKIEPSEKVIDRILAYSKRTAV